MSTVGCLVSAVGYKESDDHLADELARADLLLRAVVALHVGGLADDADPGRWGLSEVTPGEVTAFLTNPPPLVRPDFDTDPRAAGFRAEAAMRRRTIDGRVASSPPGARLRLVDLVNRFGLTDTERDALLLLTLVERHETYRRIVAYLHDNGTRPWFSPQLLAFAVREVAPPAFLMPSAPLVRHALVTTDDSVPVLQAQHLRLDWRVADFLAGRDAPPPEIEQFLVDPALIAAPEACLDTALIAHLAAELGDGGAAVLNGPAGSLRAATARAAALRVGRDILAVDSARFGLSEGSAAQLQAMSNEATLQDHLLLILDADPILRHPTAGPSAQAMLARHRGPFVLTGTACDPPPGRPCAALELEPPGPGRRAHLWQTILAEVGIAAPCTVGLTSAFPFGPRRARAAAARAVATAHLGGASAADLAEVTAACRAGAAGELVRYGQRIAPRPDACFDDLVLPPLQTQQIEELRHRVQHGRALFERVGLDRKERLGQGFTVLFAGPSGTGKTMSAELMARDRGVDLYKVNIGEVVSKWVGETEKQLAAVFAEARTLGAVLFFDECDSLFGKRGEVKEARDRWANLEVNHLLVELESHDGVVILATNLRQSLDEAFLRRIHALVEFPVPDAACRLEIWRRAFPPRIRAPDDGDLRQLAETLDLTGGLIRNIATDAIVRSHRERAAPDGGATPLEVSLRAVVVSTAREYQKLDRPLLASAFPAEWQAWLAAGTESCDGGVP